LRASHENSQSLLSCFLGRRGGGGGGGRGQGGKDGGESAAQRGKKKDAAGRGERTKERKRRREHAGSCLESPFSPPPPPQMKWNRFETAPPPPSSSHRPNCVVASVQRDSAGSLSSTSTRRIQGIHVGMRARSSHMAHASSSGTATSASARFSSHVPARAATDRRRLSGRATRRRARGADEDELACARRPRAVASGDAPWGRVSMMLLLVSEVRRGLSRGGAVAPSLPFATFRNERMRWRHTEAGRKQRTRRERPRRGMERSSSLLLPLLRSGSSSGEVLVCALLSTQGTLCAAKQSIRR
jgi:hypothetical protein